MSDKNLSLKEHLKRIRNIPSDARASASRANGAKAALLSKAKLKARAKKAAITRKRNKRLA